MSESSQTLATVLRVVYRHRWPGLVVFLVVFFAMMAYTLIATPVYEGDVQLLIEAEDPNIVSFRQVVNQELGGAAITEFYQTQYALLQSRALARQTIDGLKLWDHVELVGSPAPAETGQPGWIAKVRRLLGRPDTTHANGARDLHAEAIEAFQRRLTVDPKKNSHLVDVKFRSADPVLAAQIPNALVRGYIEQSLDVKLRTVRNAAQWLETQLAKHRQEVKASEEALQNYREQNQAMALTAGQNIVNQKLADLNAAVTRANTIRIEKQALHDQLQAIATNRESLDTFPSVMTSPFIQRLKENLADLHRQQAQLAERFGDRHPDIVNLKSSVQSAEAKLRAEVLKVVESVRSEFLAAQQQERQLVAELELQKTRALALGRTAIAYDSLQRDASSTRQLYETLLQRAKEMDVSGELKTTNTRIVDPAEVPREPVSPRMAQNAAVGVLAGLVLAAALAFGLEYLDHRIKTPDDIRSHLGLPLLALVPKFTRKVARDTKLLFGKGSPPQMVEPFRDLRASVMLSAPDRLHRFLVTSTAPGEGKSTVSANLALSIAQTGRRVLLIDVDMRRPRVHEMFDQRVASGLSEVLTGTQTIDRVIKPTPFPNLSTMTAGRSPEDPGALLGSPNFSLLLDALGDRFDSIVLDSPPILAVSDAAQLVQKVGGVIFVIRAQKTARQAAGLALTKLEDAGANLLGVVLNGADVRRHGYYYGPYYRRDYAEYYSAPQEP